MDKNIPNILSISENPENVDFYDPYKPRYYVHLKEPLTYQTDFDKLYITVQKNKEESKLKEQEIKIKNTEFDKIIEKYFDFLYNLLTNGIFYVLKENDNEKNNYLYFGITLGIFSILLFSLSNYK